jgi:preprotein translocase subunit SecY
MDIDRRGLLMAGCLGLTGLAILPWISSSAVVDLYGFRPVTKLLLESTAGQRLHGTSLPR